MVIFLLSLLFCATAPVLVKANPRYVQPDRFPITRGPTIDLQRRADILNVSTCGFDSKGTPREAGPGFVCVVDSTDNYWGFCPQDKTAVEDCPIFSACEDTFTCTSQNCGRRDADSDRTVTCDPENTTINHCYSDLLIAGPGQTYTWLACDSAYRTGTFSAASEFVTKPLETSTSATAPTTQTPGTSPSPSPTAPTSTPTSEPTSGLSNESSVGSTSSTGAVAGGVVGGLVAVLIAAIVFWFLRKKLANDVKGKEYALNDLPAYTETSTKYAHVVGESPVRTEVDAHTPPTELPPVPMDPQELYGDERRR